MEKLKQFHGHISLYGETGLQALYLSNLEHSIRASGSILQTRNQQGLETQGSGDISEARIQDTGTTKVKSQLQPLTEESEAPKILSVDTKTEDGNSVCKVGSSPSDNSIVAPLDDLAMLAEQVVCAHCTYDPF